MVTAPRRRRLTITLISTALALGAFGVIVAWAAGGFSSSPRSRAALPPAVSPTAQPSHNSSTRPRKHHPRHRVTPTGSPTPSTSPSSSSSPAAGNPFAGVTVGVDPGHDGGNFTHTAYIDHQVWNGREHENCNTTGTATDGGYTEAHYNFNVGMDLAADLRAAGANVVMTRTSNTGVGPCVNRRAQLLNDAHAVVAVDIHADGGPASGRGFTVLEPVKDGINDAAVGPSRQYGTDLRNAFEATGMPISTYDGVDGINYRDDLAGLNLTTIPQALIETGNMRNATDAALLTSSAFQRKAARAIMTGMANFLRSENR
jgi:N-acetylmuramoyl-L-alanine amidase